MNEICTDNRFELIQKYKEKLIQGTNIETAKEEMNVIDNILFRFWQMGWLEALEKQIPTKPVEYGDIINRQQAEIEQLKFEIAKLLPEDCPYATQVEVSNKLEAQITSEAVKEFAKRLKNKIKTECNPYGKPTFDYDTSIAIMRYIDNLVKEMESESNE